MNYLDGRVDVGEMIAASNNFRNDLNYLSRLQQIYKEQLAHDQSLMLFDAMIEAVEYSTNLTHRDNFIPPSIKEKLEK